jgi:hypothetical protein
LEDKNKKIRIFVFENCLEKFFGFLGWFFCFGEVLEKKKTGRNPS